MQKAPAFFTLFYFPHPLTLPIQRHSPATTNLLETTPYQAWSPDRLADQILKSPGEFLKGGTGETEPLLQ